VRKVQILLAEKGVDYDFETANPFQAADWFVALNPAKRIPVLRDRSIGSEGVAGTLPDSSVICAYLERKYPQPALYPKGTFDYGRALWLEEYADTELANRVGMGIFRPAVMSALMGKAPDLERARKTLNEELPPLFDYLNEQARGREWFVGDALSIADISVATQFGNFRLAGAKLDAVRWPDLAAIIDRILARPSAAHCLEEEGKLLKAPEPWC
jgi:glutathione S-transferase